MMHAGCVFVASIYPSRTWLSGSFESVRRNACVHTQTSVYTLIRKSFLGNGVSIHVNSKGNIPSTRGSEEGWTHDAASRRTGSPRHHQLSYSGPRSISSSDPWNNTFFFRLMMSRVQRACVAPPSLEEEEVSRRRSIASSSDDTTSFSPRSWISCASSRFNSPLSLWKAMCLMFA